LVLSLSDPARLRALVLSTFLSLSPVSLPPLPTLFPYTTLFRSYSDGRQGNFARRMRINLPYVFAAVYFFTLCIPHVRHDGQTTRSEEHTSELQSRFDLVCRLLLEKKKLTSGPPGSVPRSGTTRH